MKIIKTLALGFVATMIWNCNEPTQTAPAASQDARVPAAINALTKIAAVNAGLVPEPMDPNMDMSMDNAMPFDAEALAALKDAGLCQGFIDLFEEISMNSSSISQGNITPRLQEVVTCFANKIQADTTLLETNFFSVVDECFCKGSGTVFGNFSFNLAKYGPPKSASGYSAPASASGYSAPAAPGAYSAPSSPGGSGYSAPSL